MGNHPNRSRKGAHLVSFRGEMRPVRPFVAEAPQHRDVTHWLIEIDGRLLIGRVMVQLTPSWRESVYHDYGGPLWADAEFELL